MTSGRIVVGKFDSSCKIPRPMTAAARHSSPVSIAIPLRSRLLGVSTHLNMVAISKA